jgi:hypothetical protein
MLPTETPHAMKMSQENKLYRMLDLTDLYSVN